MTLPKAPASLGALLLFGGIVLMYWSLTGLGVISGNTPAERVANTREKLRGS